MLSLSCRVFNACLLLCLSQTLEISVGVTVARVPGVKFNGAPFDFQSYLVTMLTSCGPPFANVSHCCVMPQLACFCDDVALARGELVGFLTARCVTCM